MSVLCVGTSVVLQGGALQVVDDMLHIGSRISDAVLHGTSVPQQLHLCWGYGVCGGHGASATGVQCARQKLAAVAYCRDILLGALAGHTFSGYPIWAVLPATQWLFAWTCLATSCFESQPRHSRITREQQRGPPWQHPTLAAPAACCVLRSMPVQQAS